MSEKTEKIDIPGMLHIDLICGGCGHKTGYYISEAAPAQEAGGVEEIEDAIKNGLMPINWAYYLTNKFYGSDYNMPRKNFDEELEQLLEAARKQAALRQKGGKE